MNPREEADQRLGRPACVLEPSPPAVHEGPWFADDPAHCGAEITPIGSHPGTWDALAREDGSLAGFAAERWLGAWKRLEPAPDSLVEARLALHRIAEDVMKPAREAANGKFGLRYTRGGFGTPFFDGDRQVRVDGDELIWQTGSSIDSREPAGADASFIGDWFGFAASVLEELRAGAGDWDETRVQIWPEHFDAAVELGSEAAGARAAYGCSPSDEGHPSLTATWRRGSPTASRGELWNATGFTGAELPYASLLAAGDQRAAALEFFWARLAALSG